MIYNDRPRRFKSISGIIVGIIFALIVSNFFNNNIFLNTRNITETNVETFIDNYHILEEHWLYFPDDETDVALNNALQGIIDSGTGEDMYTMYILPTDSNEYFESMESNYVGLGVEFLVLEDYLLITTVFNHSGAEGAGVKSGDVIVAIEKVSVAGLTSEEIRELALGDEGSEVDVTILRDGKEITFTIERKRIETSINSEIWDSQRAYIEISQFSSSTATELEALLAELEDDGIEELIIDLRGNPGGFLESVQGVSDLFLPSDKIVLSTEDRGGNIITKNIY